MIIGETGLGARGPGADNLPRVCAHVRRSAQTPPRPEESPAFGLALLGAIGVRASTDGAAQVVEESVDGLFSVLTRIIALPEPVTQLVGHVNGVRLLVVERPATDLFEVAITALAQAVDAALAHRLASPAEEMATRSAYLILREARALHPSTVRRLAGSLLPLHRRALLTIEEPRSLVAIARGWASLAESLASEGLEAEAGIVIGAMEDLLGDVASRPEAAAPLREGMENLRRRAADGEPQAHAIGLGHAADGQAAHGRGAGEDGGVDAHHAAAQGVGCGGLQHGVGQGSEKDHGKAGDREQPEGDREATDPAQHDLGNAKRRRSRDERLRRRRLWEVGQEQRRQQRPGTRRRGQRAKAAGTHAQDVARQHRHEHGKVHAERAHQGHEHYDEPDERRADHVGETLTQALAVLPAIELEERTLALAPGDELLLFTDGVTDAPLASGEAYGHDRLGRALAAHSGLDVDAQCQALLREIAAAQDGRDPFDDAAVLLARYEKREPSSGLPSVG